METTMKRILWAVLGLVLSGSLMSCQKTDKQSAAGGGASSQSVMHLQGAAR